MEAKGKINRKWLVAVGVVILLLAVYFALKISRDTGQLKPMNEFSKTETYLVYCASDINAAFATEMLINAGYKAFVVVGGMQSLLDNGFNQVVPMVDTVPMDMVPSPY